MLYYQPNLLPATVAVIGAGGTGSRLIPPLAQFMKTVPWLNEMVTPKILLFDDDEVESNNLTRQNFIAPDVGRPKAEVIAQRYSRAFDINIEAYTHRFQRHRNVEDILGRHAVSVFISCVDSVAARMELIQAARLYTARQDRVPIIIDAGNEDDFGQVSVFHPVLLSRPSRGTGKEPITFWENFPERDVEQTQIDYIPCPFDSYEERTESERSCADLDQTLAVNNMMASGIMAAFQNITFRKPIYKKTVYYRLDGDNFSENILPQDMARSFAIRRSLSEDMAADEQTEATHWRRSLQERFPAITQMTVTTPGFNISQFDQRFGSVHSMIAYFAQKPFLGDEAREELAQLYFDRLDEEDESTSVLRKVINYFEEVDSTPTYASAFERLQSHQPRGGLDHPREHLLRNYPDFFLRVLSSQELGADVQDQVLREVSQHVYPDVPPHRSRLVTGVLNSLAMPLQEALIFCAATNDGVRDLCGEVYQNREEIRRTGYLSNPRRDFEYNGRTLHPRVVTSILENLRNALACQSRQSEGFMLPIFPGEHAAVWLPQTRRGSLASSYRSGMRTDWFRENITGEPVT